MPRGAKIDLEEIEGWLMRPKKALPSTQETLYYCAERTSHYQCQASFAVHDTTKQIRVIENHINHDIDFFSNTTRLARQELKRRAVTGPCRDVVDSIRREYGEDVSMALGNYNTKRRLVNVAKAKLEPDTKDMDDGGAICVEFQNTLDGQRFLISDHIFNNNRYIIFGSPKGLELLASANITFVDGTFSCVPTGFMQLFSFHAYITEDVVRPVVFALLPNKQLQTYEHMLGVLKDLPELANWEPEVVIADFELNIKLAFENKFPRVIMNGCLFHLLQAWRRHAEQLKIWNDMTYGSLQQFWKLLSVLPFIDAPNIPHYFDVIVNTLPALISTELAEYIEYLTRYYIQGSATSSARFPPELWSCALRTVNGIHRTTNTVECWHKMLHSVVNSHNGLSQIKLSDLLKKLLKEDSHTTLDAAELSANPNFKVQNSRKIKNILKDQKLKKAIENDDKVPLVDYQLLCSFIVAKKY